MKPLNLEPLGNLLAKRECDRASNKHWFGFSEMARTKGFEILQKRCRDGVFITQQWQFASEGSDIGFGLYLKTKGNETKKVGAMQEILPTERYNSHLVPEDGSYTCEEPGIYVVRFDNTYSVMHSKKVSFTVDVLLPEGHSSGKQP